QNGQRVRNDRVRLPSFDVGNEADTTRVLVKGRIIKALRGGNARAYAIFQDITSFHHSSAPAHVVIGSIRPPRRWRGLSVKRRDRAHRFSPPLRRPSAGRHTLSPLAQRRRCSPTPSRCQAGNLLASRFFDPSPLPTLTRMRVRVGRGGRRVIRFFYGDNRPARPTPSAALGPPKVRQHCCPNVHAKILAGIQGRAQQNSGPLV